MKPLSKLGEWTEKAPREGELPVGITGSPIIHSNLGGGRTLKGRLQDWGILD